MHRSVVLCFCLVPISFALGVFCAPLVTARHAGAVAPTVTHGADRSVAEPPNGADLPSENARLTAYLKAEQHRRATEDRFDIRITGAAEHFTTFALGGLIQGDRIERSALMDAMPSILDELDRYPVGAMRRTGVRRVIVCENLTHFGNALGGLADGWSGNFYLAPTSYGNDATMFRHVVHHEMFHLIDFALNGRIGRDDPEWTGSNPPGFRYGPDYEAASPGNASVSLESTTPGFVTTYARSCLADDKAETYGWLMADPTAVNRLIDADALLASKRKRMWAIVAKLDPALGAVLKGSAP